MYVVAAEYKVQEGKEKEVIAILKKMIPLSRAEPGCKLYMVNQSPEDPRKLLLGYYASHMLRSGKRGLPVGAGSRGPVEPGVQVGNRGASLWKAGGLTLWGRTFSAGGLYSLRTSSTDALCRHTSRRDPRPGADFLGDRRSCIVGPQEDQHGARRLLGLLPVPRRKEPVLPLRGQEGPLPLLRLRRVGRPFPLPDRARRH